jgi:hypothetical protein
VDPPRLVDLLRHAGGAVYGLVKKAGDTVVRDVAPPDDARAGE